MDTLSVWAYPKAPRWTGREPRQACGHICNATDRNPHGGTTISFEVSALINHKPPIHNVSFDVARSAQHDLVSPDAPLQVTA